MIARLDRILFFFIISCLGAFVFSGFSPNEFDLLPFAFQQFDQSWIPGDWYLNLKISYRSFFNVPVGWSIASFGFTATAVAGRLLSYLLFAIAFRRLAKALDLNILIAGIVLFLLLKNQSLVAQEWMIRSLETKAFAWPLIVFALASFLKKEWKWMLFCLGLATTFHLLLGLYATFSILVAVIFTSNFRLATLKHLIKNAWVFLISGSVGIWAIVETLSSGGGSEAWKDYVLMRVPHHVYPEAWSDYWAVLPILMLTFIFAIGWLFKGHYQKLGRVVLISMIFFSIGLLLSGFDRPELLRFYWFRFADSLVPLVFYLFLGSVLSLLFSRRVRSLSSIRDSTGLYFLSLVFALIFIFKIDALKFSAWATNQIEVYDWIRNNTERDASFLTSASDDSFYMFAQRQRFVGHKHSPQSAEAIAEWKRRLLVLNGNQPIESIGYPVVDEVNNTLFRMNADELKAIAEKEGFDYLLFPDYIRRDLNKVYEDSEWVVYKF